MSDSVMLKGHSVTVQAASSAFLLVGFANGVHSVYSMYGACTQPNTTLTDVALC